MFSIIARGIDGGYAHTGFTGVFRGSGPQDERTRISVAGLFGDQCLAVPFRFSLGDSDETESWISL
jgi:hypothetical protein